MDIAVMVVVGEKGSGDGVEPFVQGEGGLCMFQVLFRDPRVLFGQVFFPSD